MSKSSIKLSATRINSFLSCKQKYYFQYVKKLPRLSKPAFKLGLACHESLELAGKIWMEKGKFSKADKEKIFALYNEISIKEGIEEMDVHALGKDLVESRLKSFSLGNKIISLEEKFGFWSGKNADFKTKLGVPVMGAMDKVVELDNDSLIVVDYKTSKTVPTPDQLKDDLQLSLYDLVASIMWPHYERVILCLDMLKHDPIYTYRTPEQRKEFDKYLLEVYNQMVAFKEKDAKPSLQVLCPWCDYKDVCEPYNELASKKEYNFLPLAQLSDDELVKEYDSINVTNKILEMRKRELSMMIMEKIKDSEENLKGKEKQLYVRQNSRSNYDVKAVHKAIPEKDFVDLVSLNKKAVDEYCSKNPQFKKKIEESSTTNYTSPFLVSKKI